MIRTLIVPAAGAGSRLGTAVPKALVPVAGIPMLRRVLALYERHVESVIVVASPTAADAVARVAGAEARIVVQEKPTGMLDAILLGTQALTAAADNVWISWCDQVAVEPQTIERLAALTEERKQAALVMPTVRRADPYIHLKRDASERIVSVLHRREGDPMPAEGESDMGVFALSREACTTLLPAFAAESSRGAGTGERNFLPFIPWVAVRRDVVTFPCTDPFEAVGVNTQEELAAVESYLSRRTQR